MESKHRAYMEAVAPAETRQLDQLTLFLCENEDANLHGVYLHGSPAVSDGLVLSKLEGADWAGVRLPSELTAVVAAAAAAYTGQAAQSALLSPTTALAVADYIEAQLDRG